MKVWFNSLCHHKRPFWSQNEVKSNGESVQHTTWLKETQIKQNPSISLYHETGETHRAGVGHFWSYFNQISGTFWLKARWVIGRPAKDKKGRKSKSGEKHKRFTKCLTLNAFTVNRLWELKSEKENRLGIGKMETPEKEGGGRGGIGCLWVSSQEITAR